MTSAEVPAVVDEPMVGLAHQVPENDEDKDASAAISVGAACVSEEQNETPEGQVDECLYHVLSIAREK